MHRQSEKRMRGGSNESTIPTFRLNISTTAAAPREDNIRGNPVRVSYVMQAVWLYSYLLSFCWPVGMIYVLRHRVVLSGNIERPAQATFSSIQCSYLFEYEP